TLPPYHLTHSFPSFPPAWGHDTPTPAPTPAAELNQCCTPQPQSWASKLPSFRLINHLHALRSAQADACLKIPVSTRANPLHTAIYLLLLTEPPIFCLGTPGYQVSLERPNAFSDGQGVQMKWESRRIEGTGSH
ncbi:hypothetical protein CSPX01_13530, partial [Colletotrichum filicis]